MGDAKALEIYVPGCRMDVAYSSIHLHDCLVTGYLSVGRDHIAENTRRDGYNNRSRQGYRQLHTALVEACHLHVMSECIGERVLPEVPPAQQQNEKLPVCSRDFLKESLRGVGGSIIWILSHPRWGEG